MINKLKEIIEVNNRRNELYKKLIVYHQKHNLILSYKDAKKESPWKDVVLTDSNKVEIARLTSRFTNNPNKACPISGIIHYINYSESSGASFEWAEDGVIVNGLVGVKTVSK